MSRLRYDLSTPVCSPKYKQNLKDFADDIVITDDNYKDYSTKRTRSIYKLKKPEKTVYIIKVIAGK